MSTARQLIPYMKYLYKYPQAAYPYEDLISSSKRRTRGDMEYELLDTGIFNDNRYFDVFVEYAKPTLENILIKISISNRGPDPATIHVLPTPWFRNTWAWWPDTPKPIVKQLSGNEGRGIILASHSQLGERYLYCDGKVPLLFTENETNNERIFGTANNSPYVKDGINEYVVNGNQDGVNPKQMGTRAAAHYILNCNPGQTSTIHLRLSDVAPATIGDPFKGFGEIIQNSQLEADEFYQTITPQQVSDDEARVMRQALFASHITFLTTSCGRPCRLLVPCDNSERETRRMPRKT